jgi:predicted PurR-regulated permease PerM
MGILNFGEKSVSGAIDISWSTIFKVILAVFLVYFLYLIKDVLFWVLSGLIISILFNPAIGLLQKAKISRGLATAFVYVAALGILSLMVILVAPAFKIEIHQISQGVPRYFEQISPFFSSMGIDVFTSADNFFGTLRGWFTKISTAGIFSSLGAIFGGVFLTVTIFSLAIFFSYEERGIEKAIKLILPRKYESTVIGMWNRTQTKISGWFLARFLSMLFVGIMVAALCFSLGVDYPVFFGAFAFITDLIPFIGPMFFGVVIVLFALLNSWQTALLIGAGVLAVHQIEGNLVTPVLTKRFMEFPTSLVLISLLVGEQLWGIMGAVLAIPLFGIIYDFARDFLARRQD